MIFLPNFRFKLAVTRGFTPMGVTVIDHYWLEANGNPDWVTTKITLSKGLKKKDIKFRGEVSCADVMDAYNKLIESRESGDRL